jgi:cell division initiation protein
MTAQDIKEKTFEKAVFGGYDMAGVDDFLEEVANGVAELQKENTTLKGKLKVLVEKIEEYRSTEDAMRLALLSAQKMSVQIENEAKERAQTLTQESQRQSEETVAAAKAEAERIVSDAKTTIAAEEEKARLAKQSTANLFDQIRTACKLQMDYLEELNDLDLPAPEKKEEAPAQSEAIVRSIENSVERAAEESAEQPQISISDVPAGDAAVTDEPTRLYGAPADESSADFDFDSLNFD